MNSVTKVIITSAALLLAACGPSKEQLARIELLAQEQARIAAEAAQQEASALSAGWGGRWRVVDDDHYYY